MANLSIKNYLKEKVNKALPYFLAARPIHWIKNLTIFAPLIFTGTLFNKAYYYNSFFAFIAFCLATSATYIFNDISDVKKDRLHPNTIHMDGTSD